VRNPTTKLAKKGRRDKEIKRKKKKKVDIHPDFTGWKTDLLTTELTRLMNMYIFSNI